VTAAAPLSPLDRQMWAEVLRQLQPPTPNPYLTDPVGWVRDRLGEHLWSKQREIAESVVNHRRTAVKSCHNAGKSWIASRIAAWWIGVHPPGEAFVASTAPSYPQVHAILWEEIRKAAKVGAAHGHPVPGRVLQSDEWKLDDGTLVGWGRKPADTDEHGFQGIHRRYVLVILDEACGIPRQLWTAVEAITTNADCRILAIGNPDDPNTEFGDVCKPGSGWNIIQISAFDTPNFTDEPFPEDLRPLMLDPGWVEDKKRRWGVDSPRYIAKIDGTFPDIGVDTLFPPSLIEAAQQRALEPSGRAVLGVDVARYGTDRTVIYLRRGPVLRLLGESSKEPTTATTGRVIAARTHTGAGEIRVDGVGVGAGVVDQLAEQGQPVLDMQAGGKATEPDRFLNARAEWAWALRDLLESGQVDLDPADDDLAAQLGAIKYRYTSKGQIQIESKDEMRKRGLPSPDRADAAILTATSPAGTDLFHATAWRYWRHATTTVPGQVDCGGRVLTLADGWTYATLHLPEPDEPTGWAVAAVWCQTVGGDLLLLDRTRTRLGDTDPATLVAPLARTHHADTVFVARRQLTETLRAQAGRAGVAVTPVDAASDLFARALTASARVAAGRVWLPVTAPWLAQFTAECVAFPHGRQHGSVAVLALAAQVEMTKWQPPPTTATIVEPDPYAFLGATTTADYMSCPL
jgi:predicted phage terminase large subunit-like protein